MSNQTPTPDELQRDDDAGIERLLREVGAGEEPSRQMTEEIRLAVHAEWQAVVRPRLRRRRFIVYATAASILGIAVTMAITWRIAKEEVFSVTVARMNGTAEVIAKDGGRHPTTVGRRIEVGESLRTIGDSRIALDFGNGVTARIDRDSELAISPHQLVELKSGALYVDAIPDDVRNKELTVHTVFGGVRHVGTQYQVRVVSEGMEVGVREGRVQITSPHGTNSGTAGEQLRFSADGNVVRSRLSAQDGSWQWTATIAPVFAIEDKSLNQFLTWAARETGRKLIFDSPQAQEAAQVKLRGSIEGLDLETALTAVLSTTQLKRITTNDESIHIALATAIESSKALRPTP